MATKKQPPAEPRRAPLLRPSLVGETLSELRRRIEDGVFRDQLPGERALCEELGVSRPTLRLALQELQREGWIAADKKKARRILTRPGSRNTQQEMRVVFLRSASTALTPVEPSLDYFLAHHFQLAGCDFILKILPHGALADPGAALRNLMSRLRPKLWILMGCPLAAQRWFQEHHLNCLVCGSTYPGIDFPFLDEDYHAVCRHACGLMLAAGHTHLGLILPEPMFPGDQESREGFLEGLALSRKKGLELSIIHTLGTPESVVDAVGKLLAQDRVPSAWLVSNPYDCATALTYLHSRNIKVPGGISLLCRNSRTSIKYLVPTIARYEKNNEKFRRTLLQLALHLLKEGVLAKREHLIMSAYVPGGSFGPPPNRGNGGEG